ncbi:MAG TPA: zf-HC2 domain-containing protein [Planctomycetaceae bacterium]|nr:zf-HC2 domain-containing protein [Planctomycetaceae bacterium]
MSERKAKDADWGPCPKGEIGRMLQVIQRNRRRAAIVQTAVALAGAVLIAAAIVHTVPSHRAAVTPRELTCADVLAYAPAYLAGELDSRLRAQVEEHLRQCPGCLKRIEQMKRAGTSRAAVRRHNSRPDVVSVRSGDEYRGYFAMR